MDNKFYVYKWFNLDTGEVFYIGKGCRNRYKATSKRNKYFLEYIKTHNTKSEIILDNLTEKEAFEKEKVLTDFIVEIDDSIPESLREDDAIFWRWDAKYVKVKKRIFGTGYIR